jgi:hypothetical protein
MVHDMGRKQRQLIIELTLSPDGRKRKRMTFAVAVSSGNTDICMMFLRELTYMMPPVYFAISDYCCS